MFTSENNSRLNDNAICHEEEESCEKRISRRSVPSIRQIDTPCEGGGSQAAVENVSSPGECTEEMERRRRTRRSSHRRSTSCSTVSLSSSCSKSAKRKRKKKHKHHHRHRSNRANDSYQQPSSPTPTPKVNPIFVWIKQDDTKIVQVLCEDYDRRNRIRLTKTSNGWRSIPLTETIEKRWPLAVVESVQKNELVKSDNFPVVIKPDNPLENNQQTDNYNDDCNLSTSPSQLAPDVECRISSTSLENVNGFSPAASQHSPPSEEANKVPFIDNTDPFDSDESSQDDIRSIINKVQTDSLYSDDDERESLPNANYVADFCPVNSTCDDDNDTNDREKDTNNIQCDEVSGNEVHFSEPDTNFESQNNSNEIETEVNAPINQSAPDKENNEVLATVTSNAEIEKCAPDIANSPSENSFRSVTSQNESMEFAAHELSLENEILQFNNKQKVYHDRTTLYENHAEYSDLRDDNVESSISTNAKQPACSCETTNVARFPEPSESTNDHCRSPEESVSQSKADCVLQKGNDLKCESSRSENEVSESYQNITEISDNEGNDCTVNSSSKCEFPVSQSISSPIVANIKTEKVDTHEVIDDHVDEDDNKKDHKTADDADKANDMPKKMTNSVVLRTPLCQTLRVAKSTCRKVTKKNRTFDDLKTEPLPAHVQAVIPQPTVELHDELYGNNFCEMNVQNEPLDLGVCRAKPPEPVKNPENRESYCRKRVRDDKTDKEMESKTLKKSRLLDLLTAKAVPSEVAVSDPLEQLKNVLANPKYSVPDPLLVPKTRLSALVSCPGKEIPRLLARKTQDLSYFSILSDPDVLVVSLSHLQSLIKKPINEEEIQKYQKQTEDIRARLRQECFNNNYENMASGNWNQCYWLPSFQHSGMLPCDQTSPDVLSVLNCIPPSPSYCQDVLLPNSSSDFHKQMQYQKDAALWQEFALQQLSINHSSYDQFNNNVSSNCDLAKDGVCGGMVWNQDVCSNYSCHPPSNNLPVKSNSVPTKNSNPNYKCVSNEVNRKLSQSFLSSMPCNGNSHLDYQLLPPCETHLFAENPFLHSEIDNEKYKIINESKLRDRYDSLKQLLLNTSENSDFLQQFEASLHSHMDEERKTFKDDRQDNRPQSVRANNTNTKESSDVEATKSSRPVVPKIKVRKHLVDPNQRPTLLNNVGLPMHSPGFPAVDNNVSHLWNPFFGSNVEKNYKKLQWTTPATSKAD